MEGFLARAQNSELKIRVAGESRMLVAKSWPHWWWMAAVETERDLESIAQESRQQGWQPEQPEVRLGVYRNLLVRQVVCPQSHCALEVLQLRAWDLQ